MRLQRGFLALAFAFGSFAVITRFEFIMTLADLLLDFFRDQVDRGIQISLGIFSEQIGAWFGDANGTFKLTFRELGVILFDHDAGIDCPWIQMSELLDARNDMRFDGVG